MRSLSRWRCLATVLTLLAGWVFGPVGSAAELRRETSSTARGSKSLSETLILPSLEGKSPPVRDPFVPVVITPATGQETVTPPPPSVVLPPLRLTAIIHSTGQAAAVVNGYVVRAGDNVYDMRVIRITENEVWLEAREKVVSLMLKETLYTNPRTGGK